MAVATGPPSPNQPRIGYPAPDLTRNARVTPSPEHRGLT
jgi:hypothetical protein